MSLYAIGDFHLSFTVNKPMDVFDERWKNHVVKIEKYWKRKVTENDTVVITGDHSWGRDLAECQADLDFIMALPGRKILLRGNHDMFWDAKKTEKPLQVAKEESGFEKNPRMDKALLYFACILGTGILLVLCSSFLPFLQAYTMIIVALMFLIGGLVAVSKSGMEKKKRWETFVSGVVSILPSILMILMASSIKYMMVEGKILDTMLHGAVQVASGLPKGGLILFIYLICLVMNFFIPSGSSKAFLLIPLIVPLAQIFGLRTQLCIVAFAFGDGFSNVFYPTNPALLISLSLGGVNYGEWAKYSSKFQGLNLILTSGILLLGLVLGY